MSVLKAVYVYLYRIYMPQALSYSVYVSLRVNADKSR